MRLLPAGGHDRRQAGRRSFRFVLLIALLQLATPTPALGQSTTLRGEVLLRSGEPATAVRLVVVGHPPEVVIRDGGMFVHQLNGRPAEVTLRIHGDPDLEVIYPPDGRTPVPASPVAVVPIVVGQRIGPAVENRISEDLRVLRETLEARGVSAEEIEAVVRLEMEGLVSRIATLTRGAVDDAVAGAARAELRERIGSRLRSWLRTSQDLVDAFEMIDVSRSMSQANFLALYNSMGDYNSAWAELDASLGDTPGAVERAWPGQSGVELGARVGNLLGRVRADFHEHVLGLNAPLLVIQAEANGGDPDDQELGRARQAVATVLPALATALDALEVEIALVLAALRES